MTITDLITILGNISQSLAPIQQLLSGMAYLLGIAMILIALKKFRKVGEGKSQEKIFVPIAWLFGAATLLFLPSAITVLSGTVFGPDNILSYGNYNPLNIFHIMSMLIKTAGIIWFLRGTVLLVQASQPGVKHGSKGLLFIMAGILAMNFEATGSILSKALEYVTEATNYVRNKTGY